MSIVYRSHKSSLSPDSTRVARAKHDKGVIASCPTRDRRSVPPRQCHILSMVRVVWEDGSTHKVPLNRLRTRPDETRWPNRISGLYRMILPRETRRSGTRRTGHRDDLSPRHPVTARAEFMRYFWYSLCVRKSIKREKERKNISNGLSCIFSHKNVYCDCVIFNSFE